VNEIPQHVTLKLLTGLGLEFREIELIKPTQQIKAVNSRLGERLPKRNGVPPPTSWHVTGPRSPVEASPSGQTFRDSSPDVTTATTVPTSGEHNDGAFMRKL